MQWKQRGSVQFLFVGFFLVLVPYVDSACRSSISESSGYIFSPTKSKTALSSKSAIDLSHGDYPDNSDCTYSINTPPNTIIKLSWTTFDVKGYMPTCWPADYVEVYIGCSRKSIGKYCDNNSKKPFDMYSPDNCMEIRFKSDGSDAGTGFMAKFQSFPKTKALLTRESCSSSSYYGISKIGSSNTISSPSWPAPFYALGDSCYWRIEVGRGYGIKLAIMDFELPSDWGCDNAKLKIKGDDDRASYSRADKTLKDSICGNKSPFYLTTTEEYVWIRFKRPYSNSLKKRGFVAGYVRYEQTIKDTGSIITGAVVGCIVALAFIGCICFICWRRKRQAAMHHPPPAVVHSQNVQMIPPPTQSYPAQPPPPGAMAPPPSYGQAVGGQYPPPQGAGPLPPKAGYPAPYPQQGGYYPPPAGPPPGTAPYPPPQGGPAPYPAGPPPGGAPYPPPGGAPYPPGESAPPYPAPDGSAPPYPTQGQPYPPPGQAPYPPPQ